MLADMRALYFSIEYCTVIYDARVSEIRKCNDLPIVKTAQVLFKWGKFFLNMKKKGGDVWRKVTLDQRISEYSF